MVYARYVCGRNLECCEMLNMIAKQVGMLSEGSIATALITTSHNVIRDLASCRRLLTVSVCSPYRYPWTACISLGCQFAFCYRQGVRYIFWYHIWRSVTTRQQLYIRLQDNNLHSVTRQKLYIRLQDNNCTFCYKIKIVHSVTRQKL